MNDKQQEKYIRMTTQPVSRLVCKLAVPTIMTARLICRKNC